ncbi:MAG: ParA family protein [Flavobacterium sp.]|nr:MAG: ParA family protein [Flavobacterium sp.]
MSLTKDSADHSPKIVSCVNLKGGVGKTALAVNFAAYCGLRGKRTLLIDLDPQTNATFSCIKVSEWETHAKEHGTVANLFGLREHTTAEGSQKSVDEIIKKNVFKNVDLIPSHLDLFSIDLDLSGATARETRLRRAIQPILNNYDIIVCDCPPNLTIPTQNALTLSTHFVVPISPDFLSSLGVALLLNRIATFSKDLEQNIENAGIVISRVGRPANHRAETVTTLRATFKDLVFKPQISERVKVSESVSKHTPIYQMGDETSANEFRDVSKELLKRIGL